ncbi:hypothetical protein [Saccharothrix syringae]|nr:hypothetical protein [Saccharothrix syringae]
MSEEQDVGQRNRRAVNEDWLAVAVGLVLFALALLGVIPPGLVP